MFLAVYLSFVKPPVSASIIPKTKVHTAFYNIFGVPRTRSAFIPNERLRNLQDSVKDFNLTEAQLLAGYESIHLKTLEDNYGSEVMVNNPYLDCVLNEIVALTGKIASITRLRSNEDLVMCGGISSENCIVVSTKLCIGSEAKCRDASNTVPQIQSLVLGGEMAVELLRAGLSFADCAVPIITVAGRCSFQIYGVYLMDPSFPILTELSKSLDADDEEDFVELLKWTHCLCRFLQESYPRIRAHCRGQFVTVPTAQLRLDTCFWKPIYSDTLKDERGSSSGRLSKDAYMYCSTRGSQTNYVMNLYERLRKVPGSEKFILFPTGNLLLPNEDDANYREDREKIIASMRKFGFTNWPPNTPLIVYPLLRGYEDGRPKPSQVDAYLAGIEAAIEVLNQAQVCHGDLRAKNILWKFDDSSESIDIKLVDFEHAVQFGRPLRLHHDSRFPHHGQSMQVFGANRSHNKWFLESLRSWLQSTDDGVDYDHYMCEVGGGERLAEELAHEFSDVVKL